MDNNKKLTHIASTFYFFANAQKANAEKNKKSLQFSTQEEIELKKISSPSENKKYATAQSDTTTTAKRRIDNGLHGGQTRTPAGNRVDGSASS
jgi:hypothetical protein